MATFFLKPAPAAAQDSFAWIHGTDRRDNWLILLSLEEADLETALGTLRAVGKRQDFYVDDILERLTALKSGPEGEILVRALLESVFPSSLGKEPLRERVALNRSGIDRLANRLPALDDPLLRARVMVLDAHAPVPRTASRLLAAGRLLAARLHPESDGQSDGKPLDAEALAFLEAARRVGSPDLAETCLLLASASRSRQVVVKARRVAEELLRGYR